MKKGFLFSVDGIFAVLIALSLMAAMVSFQQQEKGKEKAIETLAQKARDKAITSFYLAASSTPDNPTGDFYYCSSFSTYNPGGVGGQSNPTNVKKCEGQE